MIRTDQEAVKAYSQDSHWYNKLYLSKMLGYRCGLYNIPETGRWIVRPIINLDGMGKGAVIDVFEQDTKINPEMFYCEVFEGRHVTIDYVRENGRWKQKNAFEGFNSPSNLVQFTRWLKVDYHYPMPGFLQNVESNHINIETIGGKLIEVHLRGNPDPVTYDDFWPIWSENQQPPFPNYKKITNSDDETEFGRLGFFVPF